MILFYHYLDEENDSNYWNNLQETQPINEMNQSSMLSSPDDTRSNYWNNYQETQPVNDDSNRSFRGSPDGARSESSSRISVSDADSPVRILQYPREPSQSPPTSPEFHPRTPLATPPQSPITAFQRSPSFMPHSPHTPESPSVSEKYVYLLIINKKIII